MDPEIVILSEVSQTEKQKHHVAYFLWNLKRHDTNRLIYKTETDTQTGRTNMISGGKGRRRDNYRVWDGHVHATIFKIDNQQRPIV